MVSFFETVAKECEHHYSYKTIPPTHDYKITKGERLVDQPYVVLDIPQIKDKAHIKSIRVIFWWGHSFGIHFIFSGNTIPNFPDSIFGGELLYLQGENLWNNNLSDACWQNLNGREDIALQFAKHGFIRIAKNISFQNHEQLLPSIQEFIKLFL
jgi:hypothetical protein